MRNSLNYCEDLLKIDSVVFEFCDYKLMISSLYIIVQIDGIKTIYN